MDYLDAMIEAREREFKLWRCQFIIKEDVWHTYRDDVLVETETRLEVAKCPLKSRFNKLRNRAVMEVAFKAAQEHLEKPIEPLLYKQPYLTKEFLHQIREARDAITKSLGIEDSLLQERRARVEKVADVTYEEAFGKPKLTHPELLDKPRDIFVDNGPSEHPLVMSITVEKPKPKIDWLTLNKQASGQ